MDFTNPSPKALAIQTSWLTKYQAKFDSCPVGMSFPVDPNDVKLTTLRPAVSVINKTTGKKFKVVDHNTNYEIYRKE